MKQTHDNLALFISEMKAYFETMLAPKTKALWDDNVWCAGPSAQGFLTAATIQNLSFIKLSISRTKGLYIDDSEILSMKDLKIPKEFSDFFKAMLVYQYKRSSKGVSIVALYRNLILLKRIYARMIIEKYNFPHPTNISSEIVEKAMEAYSLESNSIATIADQYTAMSNIVKNINYCGLTFNPIVFENNRRRASTKSTKKAKQAKNKVFHSATYSEELDEDDNEKLITINTFLNIVSAINKVPMTNERVMFNMLLLLLVTGFRFNEVSNLKVDSLRRLEIDDPNTRKILKKRGLVDYYLGIQYQGEKGAGMRTHWVDPLAIPLVETIISQTEKLTESLRQHIGLCRKEGFKTLLPVEVRHLDELILDDIATYIVESLSKTSENLGWSTVKDYSKRALAQMGVNPDRVVVHHSQKKDCYYYRESIEHYLKAVAKKSKDVNEDGFKKNIIDTKTKSEYSINYEDLLFIVPEGASVILRTKVVKPIPSPISLSKIATFLGASRNGSVFIKYGLLGEDGKPSSLNTHMPRHGINSFLAIADISDHIQAALMGRIDISQNKYYQHLALEQKALSMSLVPIGGNLSKSVTPEKNTGLDIIRDSGSIGINPKLALGNGISQNLHTYTTRKDKANFIQDLFNDDSLDIFEDLKDSFALQESKSEAKELIERHSDLHPMNLGSCMRKVELWLCPYATKCQDGSPCPYFTLTGRADEASKILKLKEDILEQIPIINELEITNQIDSKEAAELLNDINVKQVNIERLQGSSLKLESAKKQINLLGFDEHKQPKTLATLFALEHTRLKANNKKG